MGALRIARQHCSRQHLVHLDIDARLRHKNIPAPDRHLRHLHTDAVASRGLDIALGKDQFEHACLRGALVRLLDYEGIAGVVTGQAGRFAIGEGCLRDGDIAQAQGNRMPTLVDQFKVETGLYGDHLVTYPRLGGEFPHQIGHGALCRGACGAVGASLLPQFLEFLVGQEDTASLPFELLPQLFIGDIDATFDWWRDGLTRALHRLSGASHGDGQQRQSEENHDEKTTQAVTSAHGGPLQWCGTRQVSRRAPVEQYGPPHTESLTTWRPPANRPLLVFALPLWRS